MTHHSVDESDICEDVAQEGEGRVEFDVVRSVDCGKHASHETGKNVRALRKPLVRGVGAR